MTDKTTLAPIKLLHLYPKEMNIYGDWGNVLTLKKRLQWHGYSVELVEHHPGRALPDDADLLIGGGGQDSGQDVVQTDLRKINDQLHRLADNKVPMLMVCGMFQLFGRYFKTAEGRKIDGIGMFKMQTEAGSKRLIGNVVAESPFGELIGYENHSGLTTLDDEQPALARITKGDGNNGRDTTEGAIYKCVFGTYLHGSLLPKNPALADALIEAACVRKYGSFEPEHIDDRFADRARVIAKKRPR